MCLPGSTSPVTIKRHHLGNHCVRLTAYKLAAKGNAFTKIPCHHIAMVCELTALQDYSPSQFTSVFLSIPFVHSRLCNSCTDDKCCSKKFMDREHLQFFLISEYIRLIQLGLLIPVQQLFLRCLH